MSSNNSTQAAEADDSSDATTTAFYTATAIGAVVAVLLLVLFSYLRTRIPDVFETRALFNTWKSFNDYNGNRVGLVKPAPDSFFGWLSPVFRTPEEVVVKKIGLDAAMFLRFIRTSFYITAMLSLFGLIIVMPVYGSANNRDNDPSIIGLRLVTLSNVKPSSARFWVTVITEFVTAAVVMIMLAFDFKQFSILRRKYRVKENPSNYSVIVYDIPEDSRSESAITDRFDSIVPGQVANVIVIRNPSESSKLQKKLDGAVNKREASEYKLSTKEVEPQFRPGPLGFLMCFSPKVDSISYWTQEQDRLADAIHDQGSIAAPTAGAIVILTNKKAASILVQANSRTSASSWTVERAPEPNALRWGAFKVPGYQSELRALVVAVFVAVFTIFWTVPAAAIVGLASLEGLMEISAFSWLKPLLNINEFIFNLIEGLLPPTVMAVLISLIPAVFRAVVGLERNSSTATVEMKTRDYFYIFTLYGSFLVFCLGPGFFKDVDALTNEPTKIFDLLAVAVPSSGIYFATFILLKSLIPFSLMISGIIRCILRWIMLKFLAKTERQIRKARTGGSVFQYFRQYGFGLLTLFLSLAFSSFAPIVCIAGMVYFGYAYICFKYVILYSTYTDWEGGGELFPGTFWGTMLGLLLKQVIVIFVLGLKKAPVPAAFCAIPLIISACFMMIISKRYERISQHGSLLDFYEEGKKLDDLPNHYRTIYEQPAGLGTNYENLNGVAEIKDLYSEVEQVDDAEADAVHSENFDDNMGYVPDSAADRPEV